MGESSSRRDEFSQQNSVIELQKLQRPNEKTVLESETDLLGVACHIASEEPGPKFRYCLHFL